MYSSSSMNLLKLHNHVFSFHLSQITLPIHNHEFNYIPTFPKTSSFPSKSFTTLKFSNSRVSRVSKIEALTRRAYEEEEDGDLSENGAVYRKTLRLVECAMFAAVSGLAYFLSNSLGIEKYFGYFFALPIVISSMRWGTGAGRKTMVATAMLLLVLSGPVNALTYLLRHGLVGLTMGSLWRSGANWSLSILLCTFVLFTYFIFSISNTWLRRIGTQQNLLPSFSSFSDQCDFGVNLQVRAMGAVGYVLISSFLIRENILALITINIHASLTYIFPAIGINSVPSMSSIYAIFGTLVLLNCGCAVFLLHILYAIFLTRLGMKPSFTLPSWLEKAM